MLRQLTLRNIAIVDELAVSFDEGLTVITGETGAGKSILLDAIALVFGASVSPKDVLRTGADRGQVELLFDIEAIHRQDTVEAMLAENGVELADGETEVLLSREFTEKGSRSRINGVPVTKDVLAQLRPLVVDLHGQHELTSLFDAAAQRRYLDRLGDEAFRKLKRQVAASYRQWSSLRQRLDYLRDQSQSALQERDFKQFQRDELVSANLDDPAEDDAIRQELAVLRHAEDLIKATGEASYLLSGGGYETPGIADQLGKVARILSAVAEYDQTIETMLARLNAAGEELKALSSELAGYNEKLDYRPEIIHERVDRLDMLEKLKRKHGNNLAEVIALRDRLSEELAGEAALETDLEALEAQTAEAEARLEKQSGRLSEKRRKLATQLKSGMTDLLGQLALPSVAFEVAFHAQDYSPAGGDAVEFLFSANPGEALKPLAKVASGGELSRLLLALKVLTASRDRMSTLVFDEIDTGISGPTAKTVAEKLCELAVGLQVIVITHQPMTAAYGDTHLYVSKTITGGDGVRVAVDTLADEERRLSVLSRLVSGMDTSDEAVTRFAGRLRQEATAWKERLRAEVTA